MDDSFGKTSAASDEDIDQCIDSPLYDEEDLNEDKSEVGDQNGNSILSMKKSIGKNRKDNRVRFSSTVKEVIFQRDESHEDDDQFSWYVKTPKCIRDLYESKYIDQYNDVIEEDDEVNDVKRSNGVHRSDEETEEELSAGQKRKIDPPHHHIPADDEILRNEKRLKTNDDEEKLEMLNEKKIENLDKIQLDKYDGEFDKGKKLRPFHFGGSHSLDSEEEEEEDELLAKHALKSEDIVGQEDDDPEPDSNTRTDGTDIEIMPFNMKEEMKEGAFDHTGFYVSNKKEEELISDSWMDSINWNSVEKEEIKGKKFIVREIDLIDNSGNDEEDSSEMTKSQLAAKYEEIVDILNSNETVSQAIKRYGKNSLSRSASAKFTKKSKSLKKNSRCNDNNLSKKNLDILINVSGLLFSEGMVHTYDMTKEDILHFLKDNDTTPTPQYIISSDDDDLLPLSTSGNRIDSNDGDGEDDDDTLYDMKRFVEQKSLVVDSDEEESGADGGKEVNENLSSKIQQQQQEPPRLDMFSDN
ncbi:hypothetical protein SNEBB_001238 [Seison nebaliae]|nr:hypothetical protein SNEBB_001238 [Seison nebaliae]